MATHSSTLVWKIPWTEEAGGLQSMGSRLSDFTFTFHFHALEKEMATHSSALAWRIPGTAEPGGLLSMGSHRIGHNWSDLAAAATHSTEVRARGIWMRDGAHFPGISSLLGFEKRRMRNEVEENNLFYINWNICDWVKCKNLMNP